MIILTHLQKLPKNVGDLGKLIVAKGFKNFPKPNKLPNLGTLTPTATATLHTNVIMQII